MTRAKQHCAALARAHALCALSTQHALGEVHQAQGALQDARDRCDAETARLDALLADWRRALAAPRFSPTALAGWGAAVNRQAVCCAERKSSVEAAEADFAAARQVHGRAAAEEGSASLLLRQAKTRIARLSEEKRVAERDDESARRAMTQ